MSSPSHGVHYMQQFAIIGVILIVTMQQTIGHD
jgi:hypothetical protein